MGGAVPRLDCDDIGTIATILLLIIFFVFMPNYVGNGVDGIISSFVILLGFCAVVSLGFISNKQRVMNGAHKFYLPATVVLAAIVVVMSYFLPSTSIQVNDEGRPNEISSLIRCYSDCSRFLVQQINVLDDKIRNDKSFIEFMDRRDLVMALVISQADESMSYHLINTDSERNQLRNKFKKLIFMLMPELIPIDLDSMAGTAVTIATDHVEMSVYKRSQNEVREKLEKSIQKNELLLSRVKRGSL